MVKWSAELDQMLLVKVLEACEVRPTTTQYQNMAATWPDHLERPTDRAISEHLFILRKKANAMMGKTANRSPDKSTSKKTAPQANDGTPKKTPAKAKAGGKRKRENDDDESTSNASGTLAPNPSNLTISNARPSNSPMQIKKSRAATNLSMPTTTSQPIPTVSNPTTSAPNPAPELQNGGLMYDGSTDTKGWVKLEDDLEMEAI